MSEKITSHVPEEISEPKKDKGMSRRDFLMNTSTALAGLSLVSHGLMEREAHANPPEEQEKRLEKLRQKSFYEDYAKNFSVVYGDRLYTNTELLDPHFTPDQEFFYKEYLKKYPDMADYYKSPRIVFRLTPEVRMLHYFLRNGREKTFAAAEKLGCQHRQTILDNAHPLENLFEDAGINIEGEKVDWLEVPEGRSGGVERDGKRYGGKTESFMVVQTFEEKLDADIEVRAQKAGYSVDVKKGFEGLVANEITHEIESAYFPLLFNEKENDRLTEPFKSFTTEVSGLKFKDNAQAGEFLSDVSHWIVGGRANSYYRFFNPLYYMNPNAEYYKKSKMKPENNRYWYSYQVQRYAMEQVLNQKGYKNSKAIVEDLIREAGNLDYKDNTLFVSARKYFTEEDFETIAQIYKKIGVEMLKKMKPYFSQRKEK